MTYNAIESFAVLFFVCLISIIKALKRNIFVTYLVDPDPVIQRTAALYYSMI